MGLVKIGLVGTHHDQINLALGCIRQNFRESSAEPNLAIHLQAGFSETLRHA